MNTALEPETQARLTAQALRVWVSPQRQERIARVLDARTSDIAVVMDGTHDLGNIHAVVRTAEGLGFDQIHVIESQEKFRKANRTAQGTDQWVEFHRYSQADACMQHLLGQGLQILVTSLDSTHDLTGLDFSQPTALVFGNEKSGVSPCWLESTSPLIRRVRLPMVGFAQSFNVSVAAAMLLSRAYEDRVRRLGRSGNLSSARRALLEARYLSLSLRDSEAVVRETLTRGMAG